MFDECTRSVPVDHIKNPELCLFIDVTHEKVKSPEEFLNSID
jgi:hypothetical protein